LTCKNPYKAFDPYLMIQIPITRQITLNISYLQYKRHIDEESDELTSIKVI